MKLIDFIREFKTSNEPRDEKHYRQLMKDLQQIQNDPKQRHPDTKLAVMKRKAELDAWAQKNLKKEDMAAEPAKCTHCDGTGKHGDKECSVCGGRGFVTEDNIEEGHYPHIKSFDKLYGINDVQKYKDMADDAQSMDMEEFVDTYNNIIDMAGDFWEDHQTSLKAEDGVQATDMKRMGAVGKTLYVHKDGKTIEIPAKREKDFIAKGYKRSALRTEETNEGDLRMNKSAFVQMLANKIKEPQTGHGKPEFDNRLLAKMYQLVTGQDVEFQGDKFTIRRKVEAEAVSEGASMIPYYKTEKDWDGEKRVVWEFPKTWANDKELDTPYMSNASMRQFLQALGYPADFEDMSAVPVEEFIGVTTQWLKKNIGKQSPEQEPTVDKNPGGPTMISGGKAQGWMNRQVKLHNELARKIKQKYPEVTHLGFN
jgi:hypothetical protein